MNNEVVEKLLADPTIQRFIAIARNAAQIQYSQGTGDLLDVQVRIRREGMYPLHSPEGKFLALLIRSIFSDKTRGGEWRMLLNEHCYRTADDGEIKPHDGIVFGKVILDAIPIFLKELSDGSAQQILSKAREEIANAAFPAALLQIKASDYHDGEYRIRFDGQLDIHEEIWFAKILQVMKLYPGIDMWSAARILVRCGEKPFFRDYGLGIQTLLDQMGKKQSFDNLAVEVIDGTDLILPFQPVSGEASYANTDIEKLLQDQETMQNIHDLINGTVDPKTKEIPLPQGKYTVATLAVYPVMQDGVEYQAKLLSVLKEGDICPKTFRVLTFGNQIIAIYRIDSICTNGVQGGDFHCDCRQQTEVEKLRALLGIAMCLINIRDDEGRGHGEGKKGSTLYLQRLINAFFLLLQSMGMREDWMEDIGNGVAAQLFYHDSGDKPDAREYGSTNAVLVYLGVERIPVLATNNQAKVGAFSQVCTIGDTTSAEVPGVSREASRTRHDKSNGALGVQYTY